MHNLVEDLNSLLCPQTINSSDLIDFELRWQLEKLSSYEVLRDDLETIPISSLILEALANRELDMEQFVGQLHQCISKMFLTEKHRQSTSILVKILALLYYANEKLRIISHVSFYDGTLNDYLDFRQEFHIWNSLQVDESSNLFCFYQFPFLFTVAKKSEFLKLHNMYHMRRELQDTFFRAMFEGVLSPFLVLEVGRDTILRDTMYQLTKISGYHLRKQLRVQFTGEEGVDEGGIQKEFFQLIIRGIFDEKFGMFRYYENSRLYWFSMDQLSSDRNTQEEYLLLGKLFGLAIYNSVTLDLHFPLALYKLIAGEEIDLSDLEQLDPDLGRGLRLLLAEEQPENIQEIYQRNFTFDTFINGQHQTRELIEKGEDIPLSGSNRELYVSKIVEMIFQRGPMTAIQSFLSGFRQVCDISMIKLFHSNELEVLIRGSDEFFFADLQQSTQYDGGFEPSSRLIQDFWDIVLLEWTQDQQKKLLSFTTGSDRVPVNGLSHMPFLIVRNGPDADRLPTSHTCFNVLMLSDYSSKDKLRDRLLMAIQNTEGFGLI